jgi:hypothetical protein
MARLRRSKTLEKVARAIKDSDELVDHVFGIAASYRAQHALEARGAAQPVRHALKSFVRHAAALEQWLRLAQKPATSETEALQVLSTALHGSPSVARAQALTTQLWLAQVVKASDRALATLQRSAERQAPRRAAEALRATFEHHGLKVSARANPKSPSDAVRLLCAIAKDSGDALEPADAGSYLKSRPPAR